MVEQTRFQIENNCSDDSRISLRCERPGGRGLRRERVVRRKRSLTHFYCQSFQINSSRSAGDRDDLFKEHSIECISKCHEIKLQKHDRLNKEAKATSS